MSWEERLRVAAYTTPSGVRIEFKYENVSKAVTKKTSNFEFPDANGTYVQDLGNTGTRYPLQVIFVGEDCDLQADSMEAGLLEKGAGVLDHPIYGVHNVVPFGAITRRDDLKTAANQAIISVTFWETIGLAYPEGQEDPASAVAVSVEQYNAAAATIFSETVDTTNPLAQVNTKSTYTVLLDKAKEGLQKIADTQADVKRQFDSIDSSITNGIDTLIRVPKLLAFQTLLLLQAPARALTSILDRLSTYERLSVDIAGTPPATTAVGTTQEINDFRTSSLFAATYVTGSILSVINNQFTTKTEALAAADTILAQFASVASWQDDNLAALDIIDTGEAYQQLQEAVAVCTGFLVEISFSLKQERSIRVAKNTTILNVAARLYGEIDDRLDFLITSNNLTGSEILELPEGREIVYYI